MVTVNATLVFGYIDELLYQNMEDRMEPILVFFYVEILKVF